MLTKKEIHHKKRGKLNHWCETKAQGKHSRAGTFSFSLEPAQKKWKEIKARVKKTQQNTTKTQKQNEIKAFSKEQQQQQTTTTTVDIRTSKSCKQNRMQKQHRNKSKRNRKLKQKQVKIKQKQIPVSWNTLGARSNHTIDCKSDRKSEQTKSNHEHERRKERQTETRTVRHHSVTLHY